MDPIGRGDIGPIPGIKLLERLLADGFIAREQYERAAIYARRRSIRAEEALLELGETEEAALLGHLATRLRTQFVSTEKLAQVKVAPALLKLIPQRVAERFVICPVLYDRTSATLSVVAGEIDAYDIEKELALLTKVRRVRVLLARYNAVLALIRKSYAEETDAFRTLLESVRAEASRMKVDLDYKSDGRHPETGSFGLDFGPGLDDPPASRPITATAFEPVHGVSVVAPTPTAGSEPPAPRETGHSHEAQLELVNVLVALLEQDRGELRGHSAQVARLSKELARLDGLNEQARHAIALAANLHDIGKTGSYHLTAMNVARYEGHRTRAERSRSAPVKLLSAAELPSETCLAIEHMYERFDGTGFPDALSGEEIPLGARILALSDTFIDLTTSDKNPYRRKLTEEEGLSVCQELAGSLFDPRLVELLKRKIVSDRARRRLGDRSDLLVIDSDAEDATLLELRLVEQGFHVRVASDLETALRLHRMRPAHFIVSEVELGQHDGFDLLSSLDALGGERPVVFFHTRVNDRETITRALEAGVVDFIVKPTSPEVVAAKIERYALQTRSRPATARMRGVQGSLSEMSLPEVIQIFGNGRKTGRLAITSEGKHGEVFFNEGMVYDAAYEGLEGAEAVYAMLSLVDGEFFLDPSVTREENRIGMSAEGLLLEGMRRLDEAARDGA